MSFLLVPVVAFAETSEPRLVAGEKLAPEWSSSVGSKSVGSIAATPQGVLLQAENRMHALILRNNELPGTDANPLSVSVLLRTLPGCEGPTLPGLFLYWDNNNYLSIRISGEGHVYWAVVVKGTAVREQYFWNVLYDPVVGDGKKWKEGYLRILLVSRNAAFYLSPDRINWQFLGEAGQRPGAPGQAPARLILGRGWTGEKDGKADLRNDYYPDGNKQLVKTLIADFALSDRADRVGDLPPLTKLDTWEQTLAALDAPGIPRSWSFLGPISIKDAQYKKVLAPDLTDDWTVPPAGPGGQVLKSSSWTHPQDEEVTDGYVDLGEHVGQATFVLAWAKTEVEWPVSGKALLWFSSADPITIYVNNRIAYADPDDHQEWRAVKDRSCVPVALRKGRNTIKLRYRQNRGEWGFYLRLERDDAGYRIRLLEKMLEFFPNQPPEGAQRAAGGVPQRNWRAAQARHEIARCYEDMGDFAGALAAYDKAIALFANDDENRLLAVESKFRLLEFLRDGEGLVKAGEAQWAAARGTTGTGSALRALLRGEVLSGRADAAQARAKRLCTGADPATIVQTMRHLAAAFKDAGDNESRLWTLDALADQAAADPMGRAEAAIECAVSRWAVERSKAPAPPDGGKLRLACQSAAKALALLPGGKGPMVVALAQEAEADLKAGKGDRAMAGYWGALLLASCASSSDAAPQLGLSKARKIVVPEKDKDNKPFDDPAQFKKALWKTVGAGLGDAVWTGKWRFVGFTLEPTANFRTVLEPERNADKADFGGGRRWQDLDLDQDPAPDVYRGNHDLGIDLRRWSGNAQVGYAMRDFETPAAGETMLRLGACASWVAWVDGKQVGENTNVTGFRFESDCIKLNLSPGKHRLLLKLEAPPDGPFAFRVRISAEPELAVHLLVQALLARQFPQALAERRKDLQWLCDFAWGKAGTDASYAIAGASGLLFSDQPWLRLETTTWVLEHMREAGDITQAVATLRSEMAFLETTPWYSDRGRNICDYTLRLFHALVAEGRAAAADAILRNLCARRPDAGDAFFQAIALRGCLRRDSGQSQTALPFFECVVRESPIAWRVQQRGIMSGLDWCRTYRPERLMFETSHEAQAVLDAIRRQLAAGGPEDIERAMRNVTDILASAPGALNRVVDNPFYSRFVGVREYIRALLASLPEATRDVYRRVVEASSMRRLKTASELADVTELEVLANEFYYTPAAEAARNRAGDICFDRGQFAQAASLFSGVLRECDSARTPASAMLCAKLARALTADGQTAAAERVIERLRAQHAGTSVKRGGETITGARLADVLKQALEQAKAAGSRAQAGDAGNDCATPMANLARTGAFHGPAPVPGPVVWAHPLIQQASLRGAGGAFEPHVRSYVPYFPAVAAGRVFISGLDSVRAIDFASGRILWTQAWGAGGSLLKGVFNGYPVSCPTVHGGNVYVRALEGGVSSIRCYTAETGRPRWSSMAVPELRKAIWLSDPAVAHNLAFAVYLEPGDMNAHGVAALDAETGRLRWKTMLVTGSTGVKIGEQYYLSTLHLGPPAVDSGELYVSTGLSSIAAINAFSGEVKWITTYPRLHFGDPQHGLAWTGYDLRQYTSKALSRGPLSPMVAEDVVLLAPKDGCGFLALDRQSGAIRWRMELADCRFVAGVADGNVLLCDEGVTAVNAATGRVAWEYSPAKEAAYGQPALSGGVLYLPTEKGLQRVDARTGQLVGATPWDSRLGPLTNLAITAAGVIGAGENAIAALGPPNSKVAALPLYEAQELEAAGKLEAAAAAYQRLQGSKDMGEILHALAARIRILEKLGKRDEALAALAALQTQAPEMLSSFNGLWQVRKDAFARALRRRLGEQAPDAPPPSGTLSGVLTFAWQLPGENCTLLEAPEKLSDRCFVLAGNDMCCLRMGPQLDLLWRTYVGPGISRTVVGATAIAAASDYKITVLDRATGQTLGEMLAPAYLHKDTRRFETRPFVEIALGDPQGGRDGALVATDDATMYAWDLAGGGSMWRRKLPGQRAVPGGLAILGDKVLKVQGVKDEKKNESILDTYDLKTGNQLQGLPLGGRGQAMLASFSPDCRRLLYRADTRLTCADIPQMKALWQTDLPRLEARQSPFDFDGAGGAGAGDTIRYFGAENGKWHLLWLNAETGKEARPRLSPGFGFRMNGEFVVFTNDWYRTITRQKVKDNRVDKMWETNVQPELAFRDHYLLAAMAGTDRFHLLFARSRNNQDQFVFRTMNWENGQIMGEQVLPGLPARLEDNSFRARFVQCGNTLVYSARDGVFAYTAVDEPAGKVIEKLRAELANTELPNERRRSARRALVDLDPPSWMAFVAPAGTRIDGDLGEWHGTEPIALRGPLQYVPLGATGGSEIAWKGDDDLSGRVYVGWNREGLAVAVDVVDDALVSPTPGMEASSGDGLRVVVDSRAEPGSTLDRGEDFVGWLAWVNGRSVLEREVGMIEESGSEPQGRVIRAPNGRGYQYEMLIPWALIRRDPGQRPGSMRDLRLGVAVYDDDGAGMKGALELGAGTTTPTCNPTWLCNLTLVDVSDEKIERYRKIISLVPGSEEAARFLDLILLSKRGEKADTERAAELEGFIRTNPACRNTLRAVGLLRSTYQRLGEADPQARLEKFLRDANLSAQLQHAVAGAAFRMWVLADAKRPPQMIMVQFNLTGDWNRAVRAYWGSIAGTPCGAWGRDGTREMLPMGPVPKPGEWTLLAISPFDLGLEGSDVKEIALTTFGGVAHFDRASVAAAGKEAVLIDDAWPAKAQVRQSGMKFVDNPHHDGAKSWTFENQQASDGLQNAQIVSGDGKPILSFADVSVPAGPAAPAASQQELYRKVAHLIPDTPEGFAFLQRALELHTGDGKAKTEKCIEELKEFLKANPDTPSAMAIVKALYVLYQNAGEKDPRGACGQLLQEYKLRRDVKRVFYAEYAPAWSEWHVLGAFAAQGERRGLDTVLGPERAVDMAWKAVNASGSEVGWKKISNKLTADKKPNWDPAVDLRRHLSISRAVEQRGPCFGYAYTKFSVPNKRRALLLFGAQDMISIWLNGKRVVSEMETQTQKDKEVVEVQLRSGENELLLKVGVPRDQRLSFVFRLADLDGKPFPDVQNE